MIDNIEFLSFLLHLWSDLKVVYEYKHVVPDLSKEIEDLYKFNDVKIYGKIVRYGDYNYVFTADSARYQDVLKPIMSIIDTNKTYVETYTNSELQINQFVIHMYVDITKSYDNISRFVYKSTGKLPIFGNNTFYSQDKISNEKNDLELVRLHPVSDISSILDASRTVNFKKSMYSVGDVVLSGYSLWNMILDIKRANKSSVYVQFKPYALEQLQKYCYQHHADSFAILLNGELFSIPMKPLESNVFDNNMWQLAYAIDQDLKIADEVKDGSLLHVFKDASLGYANMQMISQYSVDYEDSLFKMFIFVITLLLILLFFLLVRRRQRRKMAMATALSSIYACCMFDGSMRILYVFFLFIDLLFGLIRDKFSAYIYKVSLYMIVLFISFFVNSACEIFLQNILKCLFMSTAMGFVVTNLVNFRFFDDAIEDGKKDN